MRSNFFRGLIPVLFSLFAVGGIVYGKVTGSIAKADDIIDFMVDAMKRMGGYIVLVLVIGQFTRMFLTLGYHTAFTQLLYRLGDSITNCVSPLYAYFPLLLGWITSIDKGKSKVGTVLSYLTPYAVFLLVGWIIMLIIWFLLGLPIGPDSPIRMPT